MHHRETKITSSEVTHQSVYGQFMLTAEPITKQLERLCAKLADKKDLNTAGNSKAITFRQNEML